MNKNKLFRFLLVETHFRPRLLLIGLCLGVILVQFVVLRALNLGVKAEKNNKALVAGIKSMERDVMMKTQTVSADNVMYIDDNLILQGIVAGDGKYGALINGEVYAQDRQVGEYKIISITKDTVVLDNVETKARKALHFANILDLMGVNRPAGEEQDVQEAQPAQGQ